MNTSIPTALANVPDNLNTLSPLSFKFTLKRAPTVNYFIHRVNIPGVTLPMIEKGAPFNIGPYTGDTLEYNPLTITFRVDEEMLNYFEIHRWLIDLAKTKDFTQYKGLKDAPEMSGRGVYSDITLTILDSHRNPSWTMYFTDCVPTTLNDMVFDAAQGDVQYLTATAQFEYAFYDWEKVV